jgi:hypothetical protein
LYENQLTGSIPPELANLSRLEVLNLTSNQLTGSIPPELGNMVSLWGLALGGNLLNGNIPMTLISLDLTVFYFDDTALCEPPDQAFQDWLAGIGDVQSTGVVCESDSAAAAEPSFTLYQDQSDEPPGSN